MEDKYLILLLVVAILFGASRLPSLGRNLGQGIREFKKGITQGAQGAQDAQDAEVAAPTPPDDDGTTS